MKAIKRPRKGDTYRDLQASFERLEAASPSAHPCRSCGSSTCWIGARTHANSARLRPFPPIPVFAIGAGTATAAVLTPAVLRAGLDALEAASAVIVDEAHYLPTGARQYAEILARLRP